MTSHAQSWWQQAATLPSTEWFRRAKAHQDQLTKPQGALGRLEDIATKICAIQGTLTPIVDPAGIYIFAGDHGIAEEGVSAFPQSVTGEMLRNFVHGGAAISVMAAELGATLDVINVGSVADPNSLPGVQHRVVAPGTANFSREPAMTPAQFQRALDIGKEFADLAAERGQKVFIAGEMGIGNSTAAAAIIAQLTGEPADSVTGRGTGLDDSGVSRKAALIAAALHRHQADMTDAASTLRCLGGFEIVAITGAYIRAAQLGLVVLVDGFICGAAALAATRLNRTISAYLIYSHQSAEQGHKVLLKAIDAKPLINLNLRLGEGTGAAAILPLVRLACALHTRMATFADAAVSGKTPK
jgi:nicotinate-nucleotide--dimethylbenzimidazole phosphoribosyltransferase